MQSASSSYINIMRKKCCNFLTLSDVSVQIYLLSRQLYTFCWMNLAWTRVVGCSHGSWETTVCHDAGAASTTMWYLDLPESGLVNLRSSLATRRAWGSLDSSRARLCATSLAHLASNHSCIASRSSTSTAPEHPASAFATVRDDQWRRIRTLRN